MADNLAPETSIRFQAENPKKEGCPPHARYELYKVACTIEEAKRLGATRGDLSNDFKKGFFVALDENGEPVAENGDANNADPNDNAGVAPKRAIEESPTPMKKQKTKATPSAPKREANKKKVPPIGEGAEAAAAALEQARLEARFLAAAAAAAAPVAPPAPHPAPNQPLPPVENAEAAVPNANEAVAPNANVVPSLTSKAITRMSLGVPPAAFPEALLVQVVQSVRTGDTSWEIFISDGEYAMMAIVSDFQQPISEKDILRLHQWKVVQAGREKIIVIQGFALVGSYAHTIGRPQQLLRSEEPQQRPPPQRPQQARPRPGMWGQAEAINFCQWMLNDPFESDTSVKLKRLKMAFLDKANLMPTTIYNSILHQINAMDAPPSRADPSAGSAFSRCVVQSSVSSGGEDVWLLWCNLPVAECHQVEFQTLARASPELAGPPNAQAPALLKIMLNSLDKEIQDSPFAPLRCLLGLFVLGMLEVRLHLPDQLDLFVNKRFIDEALPGMPRQNNLLLRQLVSLRLRERTSDMIPLVAASCSSQFRTPGSVCSQHQMPAGLKERVKGYLRSELAPCRTCMLPGLLHSKINWRYEEICLCGHELQRHAPNGGPCLCQGCVQNYIHRQYGAENPKEYIQRVMAANPHDSMFHCQKFRVKPMGSFELYKKAMEPVLQHFPKRQFIIEGDVDRNRPVECMDCRHSLHLHAEVAEGAGCHRGQCGKVTMKRRQGEAQAQPVACTCQCFKAPPGKGQAVDSFSILAQAKPQPLVPIDYPQRPIEKFVPTLRPYQEHAVNHMAERENNPALAICKSVEIELADGTKCHYNDMWGMLSPTPCHVRGGFLLSDMGLGKTVMSLALVLRNGVRAAADSEWAGPPGMLKGGTLIVVPPILVRQWVGEIKRHVEMDGLTMVVYSASMSTKDKKNFSSKIAAEADIVVAASSMINLRRTETDDWNKHQLNPISNVWFHRVIVDEAHVTSSTIQDISATNRWLLSGTPFGTSTYSSIREVLQNPLKALFGTSVLHYISNMEPDQLQTWVASMSLRHEKEDTYSDGMTSFLELPPISYDSVTVQQSTDEARIYKEVKRRLLDKLKSMELLKQPNWRHFLNGVVLRMRQLASDFSNVAGDPCEIRHWADAPQYWQRVANMAGDQVPIDATELERRLAFVHFDDIKKPPLSLSEERASEFLKELEAGQPECAVCLDTIEAGTARHPTVTRCGHLFCGSCILEIANQRGKCPQCRGGPWAASDLFMIRKSPTDEAPAEAPVEATESSAGSSSALMSDPEIKRIFDATRNTPSSKLKEVVAKVKAVWDEENAAKFLLFSTFEQTRVRLEKELKQQGVKVAHVSSSMSPGSQAALVQKFTQDPDCTVLLLSTQVASVGLNLTAANHIIFVDQPLSLTLQKQAVGRCHRIGQGRPVTVWSFITADTIEAAIASAAAQQVQEAIDGHAAALDDAGADGLLRKARGRYLLGKQELMTYFELTPEDIYDPLAAAAAR